MLSSEIDSGIIYIEMQRVPQPPINPLTRNAERHDFLPGVVVVAIGAVVLFCGARHLTGVETTDQNAARETDLIRAFSSSGLKYASHDLETPPPPPSSDPMAAAQALENWEKKRAKAATATWKVRVDTAATTPCPT